MFVDFFFFNDTATTEIYTLSLHDALPICGPGRYPCTYRAGMSRLRRNITIVVAYWTQWPRRVSAKQSTVRLEEHTSELQSRQYLVCRLLLEKKKNKHDTTTYQLIPSEN